VKLGLSFENKDMRIHGAKKIGIWRKIHNEELITHTLHLMSYSDQAKDEMGRTSSTHEGDEKLIQNFDRKTVREEITCQT
jgi:hypothetical protein